MSRTRQECGAFPTVAVPVPVPVLVPGHHPDAGDADDHYLDASSLSLLRDLRLRRLAEGTAPVRIVEQAGVITVTDEDRP